ncbi:YncE family protein [Frateuria soli]|uniref:YncE family protein n=1 Tax=Frateuria soli TaxID=1542730 RepID=UPI001E375D2A|nr:YncE family protein [Frateuria soli]UGB37357.1 YncE family protein [Frateuria soli]
MPLRVPRLTRALASMAMALLASPVSAASRLPLATVADVPLTGHATRWDYASLDPSHHHLFLAHLGDNVVTVFDTRRQRVVADIPGLSRVHGVLAVPRLGRIYATATGTDEVVVIDAASLKIVARIPTGDYPDGMAYAPRAHKLYVSNEHGRSDTVIDVRSNRPMRTIPLGGEVGNTQYDQASGHIFANVQTRAELVEIDPRTDKVVARIRLAGAQGNHGLYIDAPARLAFIGCEDNATLLVLDLAGRRVAASFAVGREPDVLAFDPARGWLYVASESGVVALFEVRGRQVRALGRGTLGPNAHVVAVDPVTHRAYFPLKDWRGKPVLRVTEPDDARR